MPPTIGNGKICYIEFPATDIERSADFYKKVFGWNIRKRGDGSTSFDDGVGEVSGVWVLGLPPLAGAGERRQPTTPNPMEHGGTPGLGCSWIGRERPSTAKVAKCAKKAAEKTLKTRTAERTAAEDAEASG